MTTYLHSDVSSYSGSSDEHSLDYDEQDNYDDDDQLDGPVKQVVLPLECFYKKVLSDLLICRNDSFFNFLFEQIFSRKLQATINGENVSYDQLRDHFLSLRRAYCDSHPLPSCLSSSSSASSSSSSSFSSSKSTRSHGHTHTRTHSLAPAPASVSPFSPDGSVLKFGPFIANSNNGGREGYLAAHSVLANLINPKWELSPLLSAAQLQSSPASTSSSSSSSSGGEDGEAEGEASHTHANGASPTASASSSSDEAEEVNPESTPRKRRMMARSSHLKNQQHLHERRIKYNALVVTDVLEIQWMEGIDGECRRITKFERVIRRPVASPAITAQKPNKRRC